MGVGYLTGQGGGGSNIKSIQRGIATLNSVGLSVAINSIDINKSIVKISFYPSGQYSGSKYNEVSAEISTATNINIFVNTYAAPIYVYWEVIEFKNVKSLQKGTLTTSTGDDIINITAVDQLKSTIFYSHTTSYSSAASGFDIPLSVALIGATQINVRSQRAFMVRYLKWQLIEFK